MKNLLVLCVLSLMAFTQPSPEVPPHYLFATFSQATVKMKTGDYQYAMMNYNTATEEMIFDQNGQMLALSNIDKVDTIYLNKRVFVPLKGKFCEIAVDSPISLLIQHKVKLIDAGKPVAYGGTSQTAGVSSISSVASNGTIYRLTLPENFSTQYATVFWIKKDNKFDNFFTKSQLAKLFPDKKEAIKQFVSEHKTDFEKPQDVILLIQFLNKG